MSYAVILPTLNGMRTIKRALDSIFAQTLFPRIVVVVDGGSSDGTQEFLREYALSSPETNVIYNELRDKHAIVIVHHYNRALRMIADYVKPEWYFFHADDCVYPHDYVDNLIKRMVNDKVDIASGDWTASGASASQGAGRLVSRRVMEKIGFHFPAIYGYESWILHKASHHGFASKCYRDIRFTLLNPLGYEAWHPTPEQTPDMPQGGHVFYEWGLGMRTLGYHPVYVMMRLLSDLFHNPVIPRRYAVKMAWDFFRTFWDPKVARNDPYFQTPQDKEYVRFMHRTQLICVGYAMLGLARYAIRLRWLR